VPLDEHPEGVLALYGFETAACLARSERITALNPTAARLAAAGT
jgi:hypothetical protein